MSNAALQSMMKPNTSARWLLLTAFALTMIAYWPGLSGGFLFDDYPNIVDNKGVQPNNASIPTLVQVALSSPSSEFRRPLSSLSFAVNYLASGLDPYWMKLTNLVLHLLNGWLVFMLARMLLSQVSDSRIGGPPEGSRTSIMAAVIASGWMLLPINLTAVLYVVQRMESLANLFVMLGLIGYVAGRRRMLGLGSVNAPISANTHGTGWSGLALCATSLALATAVGVLAKETAVMLPLYACLIEWALFRFGAQEGHRDGRVLALFALVLALPLVVGLIWLVPQVVSHGSWSTRDFTLGTRMLSEARIVVDYISWTLLPIPHELSFYHDNFRISTGLLAPWTTLACMVFLATLAVLALHQRKRRPLVALGIGLFLGCHLLTGTILPLELVYEHRNYFASFGLLLALVPLLAGRTGQPMLMPRRVLLGGLMALWAAETAMTSAAWGNPLLLAETLAERAPDSPRAEYELGRTYIIYSHYDPASPFTRLAYAPLERAAALPNASILPEQALIFMNSRMHLPIKEVWWDSLIGKLKARRPGVQDESSLGALTQCAHDGGCNLSKHRMVDAFLAALSHPQPSARLMATYGDYAWNVLDDQALGLRMTAEAVKVDPNEPAYHITLARMLAAGHRFTEVKKQIAALQSLNIGGRLDRDIATLQTLTRSSGHLSNNL